MRNFLTEYGFAILCAIVVILLIVIVGPVGNLMQNKVESLVNVFANKTGADFTINSRNEDSKKEEDDDAEIILAEDVTDLTGTTWVLIDDFTANSTLINAPFKLTGNYSWPSYQQKDEWTPWEFVLGERNSFDFTSISTTLNYYPYTDHLGEYYKYNLYVNNASETITLGCIDECSGDNDIGDVIGGTVMFGLGEDETGRFYMLTITGGEDVKNPDVISWFQENAVKWETSKKMFAIVERISKTTLINGDWENAVYKSDHNIKTYFYEEGMTWEEWINSEYNDGHLTIEMCNNPANRYMTGYGDVIVYRLNQGEENWQNIISYTDWNIGEVIPEDEVFSFLRDISFDIINNYVQ